MEFATKIVTFIPLDSLWTENEEIDANRKAYLNQNEISQLLKNGPVRIAIANIGDKLLWKLSDEFYKIYKADIRDHIIPDSDNIDLTRLKDNYGYLASMWTDKLEIPIILLEKIH